LGAKYFPQKTNMGAKYNSTRNYCIWATIAESPSAKHNLGSNEKETGRLVRT
jgi:hypothetical protein